MNKFHDVSLHRIFGFIWIVLGHLALIYLIVTLKWQLLLLALFVHYVIAIPGISMTYHRSISHNAVALPKWLEFIGLFLSCALIELVSKFGIRRSKRTRSYRVEESFDRALAPVVALSTCAPEFCKYPCTTI